MTPTPPPASTPTPSQSGASRPSTRAAVIDMATATSPEIDTALTDNAIMVLPVGSVEQHGPHLPINTDSVTAVHLARRIETDRPLVIAPVFGYAAASQPRSGGGRGFTASIGLPASIAAPALTCVVSEILRHGFVDLLVLNGHMENMPVVFEALETNLGPGGRWADAMPRRRAVGVNWWDFVTESHLRAILGTVAVDWGAEHAGILETSLMLALAPDLVRSELITSGGAAAPQPYDTFPARPDTLWPNGIGSTAVGSSTEIGEQLVALVTKQLGELVTREFGPPR